MHMKRLLSAMGTYSSVVHGSNINDVAYGCVKGAAAKKIVAGFDLEKAAHHGASSTGENLGTGGVLSVNLLKVGSAAASPSRAPTASNGRGSSPPTRSPNPTSSAPASGSPSPKPPAAAAEPPSAPPPSPSTSRTWSPAASPPRLRARPNRALPPTLAASCPRPPPSCPPPASPATSPGRSTAVS